MLGCANKAMFDYCHNGCSSYTKKPIIKMEANILILDITILRCYCTRRGGHQAYIYYSYDSGPSDQTQFNGAFHSHMKKSKTS